MAKLDNYLDEKLAQGIVKYAHFGDSAATKAAMELFPEMINARVAKAFMQGKLSSKDFRYRLSELLDKQGLNLYNANNKLAKLLDSKRAIVVNGTIEYVDNTEVQSRNLELLYKLHKVLDNKIDNNCNDNEVASMSLSINPDKLNELKVIIADLKELNDNLKTNRYHREGEVIEVQRVTD